jgi:hypothetical protein
VKRVEVKGKSRFDQCPSEADLADQHRLKHHDLPLEASKHRDALCVPFV